jgi:hypothetical protein
LVEETYLNGSVQGPLSKGYLFKTASRDFYVADQNVVQNVIAVNPTVKIYQSYNAFQLIIEDFEKPVICRKIKKTIETQIDGSFNGWSGGTVFKMMDGQVWQQAVAGSMFYSAESPHAMLYEDGGLWFLSVEDVGDVIEVVRIK